MSVLDFATLHAHHLTDVLPSENALEKVLLRCILEGCFDSVEENVQELLRVFLLHDRRRAAVEVLERKAPTEWIVIGPLRKFEVGDQSLQLMKHVIVDLLFFVRHNIRWLIVVHGQHVVSEAWHHEELLQHAVHVADATQILESNVGLLTSTGAGWLIVPGVWSFDRFNEWFELLFEESPHRKA